MKKTQQDYIRKQAKVKTAPAPTIMRTEMTAEEAEKARAERKAANKAAAEKPAETETTAPTKAGKTKE